ncbi:MAG: phosphoadenylyl-sulfate reductase [Corynebacterium sp.]|nr:phosphoadenylyl-sulfate reductase [Corynebacterium sp.]
MFNFQSASTAIKPGRPEVHDFVARFADDLYDATAEQILSTVNEHFPEELGITVTLSMENTVLAELASRYLPRADFLFLDTGFHFPETLQTADQVEARYPQRLVRAQPLHPDQAPEGTWKENPTLCCDIRKVEPLNSSLANYDAWVTGLRRIDNPLRVNTPAVEVDKNGRLKINPIASWTLDDTENYIEEHNLIRNPLIAQGYPSIGCLPCTRKVKPGEDPRSGRWAGFNKTECGLHT